MNETGVSRIVAHFLNLLIVIELSLWNRKERQCSWACTFQTVSGFSRCRTSSLAWGLVRYNKFPQVYTV